MDLPMDAKIFKSRVNLLVLAESANWSGIEETLSSRGFISIEGRIDPNKVVAMLQKVEKDVYFVNMEVEDNSDKTDVVTMENKEGNLWDL
ncbi:hypothetical protein POTOM_018153 [Populus tomentosa]|uniref:Uncharacterized protein n=1 Tax=Populus tomentosa TaxID=118781 RepID=A0A8X8CWC8_POPTO|nr:hypothetical protein POTOM_018153 [Populus tomentosa]